METAQKIQAEIFNARNEQEGILEIFADPKWSSHKVIGSKDFIEKKYREWGQYKDSA
ncbi:MAG: hypothetical protein NE328_06515 [Lentisphaeraceae bacterium]|nr:hypothetical protein [Lentisphaeraceae bacterium]